MQHPHGMFFRTIINEEILSLWASVFQTTSLSVLPVFIAPINGSQKFSQFFRVLSARVICFAAQQADLWSAGYRVRRGCLALHVRTALRRALLRAYKDLDGY
ncbi:MAG: hypothetical protein IPI91_16450 [Flavobacteriales bacterium]|nr:hypothetical protein [Flavobacteriales bacterium]